MQIKDIKEKIVKVLQGKDAEIERLKKEVEEASKSNKQEIIITGGEKIKFPEQKEFPKEIKVNGAVAIQNLPDIQEVKMDRPVWWQDAPQPAKFPEKIKINWEDAPKQKDEQPGWVNGLFISFFETLAKLIGKFWSKGIEVRQADSERLKPQLVIQIDPESGRPIGKEKIVIQGGGFSGNGYSKNAAGTIINPATEDTLAKIPGLSIPIHDYVGATYPDGVTEVYIYKSGGAAGTVVATVTVVYSDATKENLTSVTKS